MKIIKFRGWNKRFQEMHYDMNYIENPSWIFTQGIEIFDINGKEIYEGDIIEQLGLPTGGPRAKLISIVEYVAPSFIYKRVNMEGFASPWYLPRIIGNIYENYQDLHPLSQREAP